jgi:hypothetical protein
VLTYSGVNKRNSTLHYVLKSSPIKTAKQLLGAKVVLKTLGAIDQAAVDQYLKAVPGLNLRQAASWPRDRRRTGTDAGVARRLPVRVRGTGPALGVRRERRGVVGGYS